MRIKQIAADDGFLYLLTEDGFLYRRDGENVSIFRAHGGMAGWYAPPEDFILGYLNDEEFDKRAKA